MNNLELANEGLRLLDQDSHSNTAVFTRLRQTSQLTTYLLAQRQPDEAVDHTNIVKLFEKMDRLFNESDLRDICFRLSLDYESLGGRSKRDNVRELITTLQRHGRFSELLTLLPILRPKTTWAAEAPTMAGIHIVNKLHLAVVVDVTRRPLLMDVARYLEEIGVNANFVWIKNTQPDRFLQPEDNWETAVKTFTETMYLIKPIVAGVQYHFFLSAPGALLFGLGNIWGTVDGAKVYHYENNTYYPVITITRSLR